MLSWFGNSSPTEPPEPRQLPDRRSASATGLCTARSAPPRGVGSRTKDRTRSRCPTSHHRERGGRGARRRSARSERQGSRCVRRVPRKCAPDPSASCRSRTVARPPQKGTRTAAKTDSRSFIGTWPAVPRRATQAASRRGEEHAGRPMATLARAAGTVGPLG